MSSNVVRTLRRAADIQRITRRLDRALTQLENQDVTRLTGRLRRVYANLESDLRRRWPGALKDIEDQEERIRAARARVLFAEVSSVLEALMASAPSAELARRHFEQVFRKGVEEALDVLESYGARNEAAALREAQELEIESSLPVQMGLATFVDVGPQWDVVNRAASVSVTSQMKATDDFRSAVERTLVEGLVRGWGVQKMTANLRAEFNTARFRIERAVRTESQRVYDEAHQQSYQQAGVQFVQRIAVMDARTCEYCAARAGEVYVIGEAPAALHPNDRCYMLPWKPEWVDQGIVDTEWIIKHQHETQARLRATGKEPAFGERAPFERMNGLEVPTPVWIPPLSATQDPIAYGLTGYGREKLATAGGNRAPPVDSRVPREYLNHAQGGLPPQSRFPLVSSYSSAWAKGEVPMPDFSTAKDAADAAVIMESWLKRWVGTEGVFLDGLSTEASEALAQAFHDVLSKFPDLTVGLTNLVTTMSADRPGNDASDKQVFVGMWETDSWANTNAAYAPAVNTMLLNPKLLTNAHQSWTAFLNGLSGEKWSSTEESIYGIIVHELGHVLERTVAEGPASTLLPQLRWDLDTTNKVEGFISQYAKTNYSENFAEVFASLMQKPRSLWGTQERRMAEFLDEAAEYHNWPWRFNEPTVQPSLFGVS